MARLSLGLRTSGLRCALHLGTISAVADIGRNIAAQTLAAPRRREELTENELADLGQRFDLFDTDGDGTITAVELDTVACRARPFASRTV